MLDKLKNYVPPCPDNWHGRHDSEMHERYYQLIECVDIRNFHPETCHAQIAILGFCSDEGVSRNQGRPGAKLGPKHLRDKLGSFTCQTTNQIIDFGDIVCNKNDLETAQRELASIVGFCHQQALKLFIFGGGHETAWGHFQGLTPHYSKIGIINFDAHFDIRSPVNEQGTSGTPFYQAKQWCDENNRAFDYCCLGIQETANPAHLFERAFDWSVPFLSAEQINQESFAWQTAFIDDFLLRQNAIYLSICMDVFAECFAPGVSAPQSMGITPWQALPLLKYIVQTGKVISLDIVELSPPLDDGGKTARLAAKLAAELLNLL